MSEVGALVNSEDAKELLLPAMLGTVEAFR